MTTTTGQLAQEATTIFGMTGGVRLWLGLDDAGRVVKFWTTAPVAHAHAGLRLVEYVCTPAAAPALESQPTAAPVELLKIGELLRTQDNRFTEAPMFVVEQKAPVVSDADYSDCRVEWRESERGDYELASPERAARLEALYQAGRDTEGWTRYEMTDVWEFVTACFTEQGCRDYLARNAHNLRETRIYAYGSFRNQEYRAVRNWLMSLPAPAMEANSHE